MNQPTFRSSLFALLESYAPQLLAGPEARVPFAKAPKLAAGQIGVFGVLGQNDWYTDTDYQEIRTGLQRALADPSVKNIDLVIDSPGGSVVGLPETAAAIAAANRIKPVRANVIGMAASAAYWLSSQASTIRLTPSGEVGSVGVLDLHVDITKALDTAGLKITPIVSDPKKVEFAPSLQLSDDAKAYAQRSVNEWYGQFLGAVRSGRGSRVSPGSTFGSGRMLSSKDALASGLVDFIGGAL